MHWDDDATRARAGSYAAASVGRSPSDVVAATRFARGNRHAVYKVTFAGSTGTTSAVVVRVSYSGADADRAQAQFEAAVLNKVGGVAGPVLHDFRHDSQWFATPAMCLQFVPGQHREPASVDLGQIQQLGDVVGWVHQQSVDDLIQPQLSSGAIAAYAHGRLRAILTTLAWARDPLPGPLQARLNDAAERLREQWNQRRVSAAFTADDRLALLHGDIAPDNVLWGPEPCLIDWEYARVGDPADEIAYLFDQNGLTDDQRQAFWRGYQQRIESRQLQHATERVAWWEPLTLLGSTLWWAERYVRRVNADASDIEDPEARREPDYYLDHVLRRLERLDSHVQ